MRYLLLTCLFLSGCATTGPGSVSVGNSHPSGDCEEIGQVIGTSNSTKNSHAKAMEDLKYEASLKSGNYVRVLATSAHGAAIRGIAYRCD